VQRVLTIHPQIQSFLADHSGDRTRRPFRVKDLETGMQSPAAYRMWLAFYIEATHLMHFEFAFRNSSSPQRAGSSVALYSRWPMAQLHSHESPVTTHGAGKVIDCASWYARRAPERPLRLRTRHLPPFRPPSCCWKAVYIGAFSTLIRITFCTS